MTRWTFFRAATAVLLPLAACRDSTPPPVPTTIVVTPATVSLDAIGAMQSVAVYVRDQHGQPMLNVPVSWTSSAPATASVAVTGTTSAVWALVTAVGNGAANVTVTAGSATGTVAVSVAQVPTAFFKAAGDQQTGIVAKTLGTPLRVLVQDRLGAPMAARPVTFAVTQGSGTITITSVTTDADGAAGTSWTLGNNTASGHEVTATLAGNAAPLRFTANAIAGTPTAVIAAAGNNQTGKAGSPLPISPTVRVVDGFGNPASGISVTFGPATAITAPLAFTNSNGMASAGGWTLSTIAGANTLTGTVSGLPPATFTATGQPVALSALALVAGDGQIGFPATTLPIPPSVRAVDAFGNGIAGVAVIFTVSSGGGTVSGATQTTGANGLATIGGWVLGASNGPNTLTAAAVGSSIPPTVFTATASDTPIPGIGSISSGNNQATMAGSALTSNPTVLVRTPGGAPAPGQQVTFAVASGGGTITGATATTDANGRASVGSWTVGGLPGPNTLTATITGSTLSPIVFTAVGCSGGGGAGYGITLCVTTPMTAGQRAAFENAAARWQNHVLSDLPDLPVNIPAGSCAANSPRLAMTVDDLVIFAAIENIDGVGNILGSAGWCLRRDPGLPIVGVMRFDVSDVNNLEASGRLGSVILHEMGHVLGIGTLWTSTGLLKNPSSVGAPLDTYLSGTSAVVGFNAIGGTTYTAGLKVPVENQFGSGTINSHWRESVLQNELMTGFLNSGMNPLSELTLRSLEDIGYTVNVTGADPLFLALTLRVGIEAPGLPLGDDIYAGPQYTIDVRSRLVRIR